ncbi:MAG: hypothetical protein GDA44_02140 [Prochloron sp. SP5CPC1]|nr:hypothetical protein [Candidatus Paraprochloron terpiosi SP5CPC1]
MENIRELSFVSEKPITEVPYTRYRLQLLGEIDQNNLAKDVGKIAGKLKWQHKCAILADIYNSAIFSPISLPHETKEYRVMEEEPVNLAHSKYQRFLFQVCNLALFQAFNRARRVSRVDYYRKRIYSQVSNNGKYEAQRYLTFDFLRDKNQHLVLTIDFGNEYRSRQTIYELGTEKLREGERLIHTYDGKSCEFIQVGEDTIDTRLVELGNKSVLQYHRKNGNLPSGNLNLSTPVVKVRYKSKGKKDFEASHMPQLLKKLYDRTEIDNKFWEQQLLPIHDKVKMAIKTIDFLNKDNKFQINSISVPFSPSLRKPERLQWFLQGDNKQNLDFGQVTVEKPGQALWKGKILEKPEEIKCFVLYPKSLEKEVRQYSPALKREFARLEIDLKRKEIPYNPKDPVEIKRICQELKNGEFVFAFVPESEHPDYDRKVDPYKTIKNELIKLQLPSQMMNHDTLKQSTQSQSFIRQNLILGINAKLGYSSWRLKEMPGNADAFIGLDIGRKNNRAVGASAFVIDGRGELIGWSNTELSAHLETFDSDALRNLLLDLALLYQQKYNSPLKHLVIHRDGDVTKPEREVFKELLPLLQKEGLEKLDVVEVIKSGTCRAVAINNGGYTNPEKGYGWEHCPKEAIILTTGKAETKVSKNSSPRPLRIRLIMGDTDILTLAGQVYWLSEMQVGSTQTIRLPITTYYADRAAEYSLEGLLPPGVHQDQRLWFL